MATFEQIKRQTEVKPYIFELLYLLAGSLLLAWMSQIEIPIYPVPVTLQSLAVLLIGAFFGSKRGMLCILLYLSEGLMGLPVFAGGASGLVKFIGPTGGYLIGFVAAAYLVGYILEKSAKTPLTALAALVAGSLTILMMGTLWLTSLIGFENACTFGFFPFLIGDFLKVVLGSFCILSTKNFLK